MLTPNINIIILILYNINYILLSVNLINNGNIIDALKYIIL